MKCFEIRMRRTILEIYFVYAENERLARERADTWDDLGSPLEIDQEDFEVISVKEEKD